MFSEVFSKEGPVFGGFHDTKVPGGLLLAGFQEPGGPLFQGFQDTTITGGPLFPGLWGTELIGGPYSQVPATPENYWTTTIPTLPEPRISGGTQFRGSWDVQID